MIAALVYGCAASVATALLSHLDNTSLVTRVPADIYTTYVVTTLLPTM